MRRTPFLFAFLILAAMAVRPLLAEDSPFLGSWKPECREIEI
jgi:hypothetical protein